MQNIDLKAVIGFTGDVPGGLVLYCTVLYCTAMYCTELRCTALYCTVRAGSDDP